MLFTTALFSAALALATLTTAKPNTVHFINQDSTDRTIVFTGQDDQATIPSLTVPGLTNGNQTFPTGWIGNWYSVSSGKDINVPGMLGEVRFNGYGGNTYFDVSAIVNPNDHNGVKEIFPLGRNKPVSGCQKFPCKNAYNQADDLATLSTDENELICLLGTSKRNTKAKGTKVGREFVEN